MTNKSIIPILMILILIILAGCSTQATAIPATSTPSTIPATQTVPPSATTVPLTRTVPPSATPIQPTETATPLPPTPTAPPVNAIQHIPTGQELTLISIHMLDTNVGWAIGGQTSWGDHVLRTSDGGSTWTDLTPPEEAAQAGDNKTATGYFQDAQTAWVIFSNTSGITPSQSVVWRTQDGGLTWQASQPLDLTNLTEFYNPSNLQFVNGQTGWLMAHVGVGMMHDYIVLYRSQDGGVNWARIQDPYNDTSSIMSCSKTGMLFSDATHGWLTGDCHGVAPGVLLYQSNDGGVTWKSITLPEPTSTPGLFTNQLAGCGSYNPFFFSNDLGHLAVNCAFYDQTPVKYQYFVYTTQDGGSTWTYSTYPGEALYFFSDDTGWALAMKIHRTSDGGLTWTAISDVTWSAQVDFISEQIGWAVAQSGEKFALVKTVNGGARWSELIPTVGP